MEHELARVSLFKCKKCGTRMFLQDCRGHMDRHGIHTNGNLKKFFVEGPKDTPTRPGSDWKSIAGPPRKPKAPNPKDNVEAEVDDVLVN